MPIRDDGRQALIGSRKSSDGPHMLQNMFKGVATHGNGGVTLTGRFASERESARFLIHNLLLTLDPVRPAGD